MKYFGIKIYETQAKDNRKLFRHEFSDNELREVAKSGGGVIVCVRATLAELTESIKRQPLYRLVGFVEFWFVYFVHVCHILHNVVLIKALPSDTRVLVLGAWIRIWLLGGRTGFM
jgi:hypothetical protein